MSIFKNEPQPTGQRMAALWGSPAAGYSVEKVCEGVGTFTDEYILSALAHVQFFCTPAELGEATEKAKRRAAMLFNARALRLVDEVAQAVHARDASLAQSFLDQLRRELSQ